MLIHIRLDIIGLQLSCFGHVRPKNNSELPCRLELCLTFRLGIIPGWFPSSQEL